MLAHDIPNERIDRSIQVSLSPGSIAIDYEVSLTELTLTQDLRRLIGSLPGADRQEWLDRYGQVTGPLNAKGFLVSVLGEPIQLSMRSFDLVVEDHPRYTFHLTGADSRPAAACAFGTRIMFRAKEPAGWRFADSRAWSSRATRSRATWRRSRFAPRILLSDEDERRTKQVQVEYRAAGGTGRPNPRSRHGGHRRFATAGVPLQSRRREPKRWLSLAYLGSRELLDGTLKTSWFLAGRRSRSFSGPRTRFNPVTARRW